MDHKPYTPAAKTNIMATWRRFGFIPPSEDQACQDKWQYFRSLYLKEPETCESSDIAPSAKRQNQ
jgi:hypothetical protein